MIAQLDLFAAPPPPVACATVPAPAPLASSPDCGTGDAAIDDDAATIAAERQRLHDVCTRGRTVVAVDPKRLDKGGDIDRSYSADSICNSGKLRSTFRLNGADYVNTGGLWWRGDRWCDCVRVVPLEQFEGESAPYAEHDRGRARDDELGTYHAMRCTLGSRAVVLVGPKIVVVAGEPEQGALL